MTVADSHARRSPNVQNWHDANQRFLSQSLEQVRQALIDNAVDQTEALNNQLRAALNDDLVEGGVLGSSYDGQPFTVELLARTFELNEFELSILLLCAGMELDEQWAQLCQAVSGKAYPTFGLALSIFKKASWEVLTPSGTLRRSHLIKLGDGSTLVHRPLHIDERVLHYLTGIQYLDEQLQTLMTPVHSSSPLIPSHTHLVKEIVTTWTNGSPSTLLPVIQIMGEDSTSLRTVAFETCQQLGLTLQALPVEALPTDWQQLKTLSALCEREYQLSNMAILLHGEAWENTETERGRIAAHFIDTANLPLIITSRDHHLQQQRAIISLNVTPPSTTEQRQLWESGLGKQAKTWKAPIRALTSQFNMSPSTISKVCIKGKTAQSPEDLWHLCRLQTRPKLDKQLNGLAQRHETKADWDSLVLPDKEKATLKELSARVAQRSRVYEDWGFNDQNGQTVGISALFSGAPGTGKTTAAEVISRDLNIDSYRIDLNSVVGACTKETKNTLRYIFDTAESSGVTLLFDNTDNLFGTDGFGTDGFSTHGFSTHGFDTHSQDSDSKGRKTEDGKAENPKAKNNSADRAMVYLLQRMATYKGLSILTNPLNSDMKPAFLRHFQAIIQFSLPKEKQRVEIWRKALPTGTPTEGLAFEKLAKLSIAGGNIRNIALNAAFIAAAAKQPVTMKHLLLATEREYLKLGKPLTDTEIRNWL